MERTFLAAALTATLSACGGDDPDAQLNKIDQLMAKKYPLSAEQVSQIPDSVANGKRLLAEGKREQASTEVNQAIEVLAKAADADRLNNSA
jgi:type IV pilus biogenesis protein CpaD/CtpE